MKKPRKDKQPAQPSVSGYSEGNSHFTVTNPQVETMSPETARHFKEQLKKALESSESEESDDEARMSTRMADMNIDDPTPPISRVKSNPGPTLNHEGLTPSDMPPRPHSNMEFPTAQPDQYPIDNGPHHYPNPYAPPGYPQGLAPHPQYMYPPQRYPNASGWMGPSYTTTMSSANTHISTIADSHNDNSIITASSREF